MYGSFTNCFNYGLKRLHFRVLHQTCCRHYHLVPSKSVPLSTSEFFAFRLVQSFLAGIVPSAQFYGQNMLATQRLLGLAPPTPPKSTESDEIVPSQECKLADVVFISVDVEAYEYAQQKITEVGVAVLDTRSLIALPPGPNASTWISQIKTRHLRIDEYKKLVNKRFIKGCPDKFNFGPSEFIPLRTASSVLTSIFRTPSGESENRNIVLVGHGLSNDTKYLSSLHFNPYAKDHHIQQSLDTQTIAGSTKKLTIGLERLLLALGADFSNLHNAGNDAAYTLQALLMMAVKQTECPGELQRAIVQTARPAKTNDRFRRRGGHGSGGVQRANGVNGANGANGRTEAKEGDKRRDGANGSGQEAATALTG